MSAGQGKGDRSGWLAGRPIRTKLALLLVPPVVAVVVSSMLFGYGSWSAAAAAERARRVVVLGAVGADLAAQIQQERAAAGLVFARRSRADVLDAFRRQSARTEAVLEQFTAARAEVAVPAGLVAPLVRLDAQLADLPLLREQVRDGRDATATTAAFRYRAIVADIVVFRAGMAQLDVEADTATGLRASASLSQAIEGLGLLQMAVLPWIGADLLPPAAQQQVVSSAAAHTEGLETFRLLAPQWQTALTAGTASREVVAEERLTALAVSAAPNTRLALGTDASGWIAALNARIAQLHAVEARVDSELLAAVTRQRDGQYREIGLLGATVAVILLVLAASGWWVTRSMTRPLRTLADGATEMAVTTLPAMVDRLASEVTDPRAMEEVLQQAERPLPGTGHDEISLLSTAFRAVTRQAIRLAGVQAQSRAATALVAQTLGRQLQRRVDRLTKRLDDLISAEEDPTQLQLLYNLDEAVQPLRLLINNLRVLAGGRAGLPAKAAMALPDVVIAAAGQVDGGYRRLSSQVATDVLIEADTAEEVVHLLTVLIDNALRASAAPQPVQVFGQRINDRVVLQVSDTGVGIPGAQLAELQHRLTDVTAGLDADTARHMGLAVVGRISRRLGITVALRSQPGAGTRVDIELPGSLVQIDPHGGRPDPATVAPRHDGNRRVPGVHQPQPVSTVARPVAASEPDRADRKAPSPPVPAETDPAATRELPMVGSGHPSPNSRPVPELPLQIFDEVSGQCPWFTPAGTPDRVAPSMPDGWQQASALAERYGDELTDHATTANGLPKRRPGRFVIPTLPSPSRPMAPRQRNDPSAAARGLSSLSDAVRAGRPAPSRTHS